MGEIADMMLDGVLCQQCGEFIGEGDGYAVTCAGCAADDIAPAPTVAPLHHKLNPNMKRVLAQLESDGVIHSRDITEGDRSRLNALTDLGYAVRVLDGQGAPYWKPAD